MVRLYEATLSRQSSIKHPVNKKKSTKISKQFRATDSYLKKIYPLLQLYVESDMSMKRILLENVNDKCFAAMLSVAQNAFHNDKLTNSLPPAHRDALIKKLDKDKIALRKLFDCNKINHSRGNAIQVGGSLGLLMGAIIPLLTKLFT